LTLREERSEFIGRAISKRAVRACLVVIVSPGMDVGSRLCKVQKPVRIETFIAKSTVERFDVAVLHGTARFDVAQQDSMLFAPGTNRSADKLGPVIDVNFVRQASGVSELFKDADHTKTWETGVCFGGQTLSCVLVDDRQHTKRTALCQGVTDEVHRPTLVGSRKVCRCGGGKPLPTVPTFASSHRQPELAI
jgi:hypothetical protein